jgi:5'/3'-nucleotidase SurE
MRLALIALALACAIPGCLPMKILISNDDSWATANIRAIYYAAKEAGHDAIISAPAMQQSGRGRLMREPVPLAKDGEFGAVKKGAPAEGHDTKDGEQESSTQLQPGINAHVAAFTYRSHLVRQFDSRQQCQIWPGGLVSTVL